MNCCWNSAQNAAEAMNSGMKAYTRLRSTPSTCLLERITTKYTTAAMIASQAMIGARFSAVTKPKATSSTITTTAATATAATLP